MSTGVGRSESSHRFSVWETVAMPSVQNDADASRSELIDLLGTLIAAETVNPPGNEQVRRALPALCAPCVGRGGATR